MLELARAKVLGELRSRKAEQNKDDAKRPVTLQSSKKEAQLAHRFSEERFQLISRCFAGECGCEDESRIMCMENCGRGLHAHACANVSKARAQLGVLVCLECRAAKMSKVSCSAAASQVLQKEAWRGGALAHLP